MEPRDDGCKANLLLPSTLLVAIGLQALSALVLVHLQATFLFQVSHGLLKFEGKRLRPLSLPVKLNLQFQSQSAVEDPKAAIYAQNGWSWALLR